MILSDHGFHSDRLRPREVPDIPAGPCAQHRPLGIFAMKGAGIVRDERIYGVSLLDVAPTVLALFGLPAGEDMPGRVLSEVFETPPPLDRIPSWESVGGESGMHPEGFEMPEEDANTLIAQFVALGYVDEPKEDRAEAAADCERERQWNLARVLLSTWRYADALPVLERIHAEKPERSDYALALADCQRRLGLLEEAAATVEATIAAHRETPLARYVLGNVAFEQGRLAESLDHFHAAENSEVFIPELPMRIGFGYLKLRRWKEAEGAFERALEIDPHNPLTHQGLGLSRMRQQRLEEAAHALLVPSDSSTIYPSRITGWASAWLAWGRRIAPFRLSKPHFPFSRLSAPRTAGWPCFTEIRNRDEGIARRRAGSLSIGGKMPAVWKPSGRKLATGQSTARESGGRPPCQRPQLPNPLFL